MKEYHLHKGSVLENAEQIIITSVIRDEEDQSISIEEIFVITSIGDKEVKTRIDIENLIEKIIDTPGGNIPIKNYDMLFEMIDPVTPEQVQIENKLDLIEHKLDNHKVTDDLIFASDMATYCKATEYDNLVEDLLNANITHNK